MQNVLNKLSNYVAGNRVTIKMVNSFIGETWNRYFSYNFVWSNIFPFVGVRKVRNFTI